MTFLKATDELDHKPLPQAKGTADKIESITSGDLMAAKYQQVKTSDFLQLASII